MTLRHTPGSAPDRRRGGAARGRPWRLGAAVGALCAIAGAATAADRAGTALDRYLDGLKSLRTAFTQTVSDAHGNPVESGSGSLIVQRPGRFRWDYRVRSDESAAGATAAGATTGAATAAGEAADQRGQLLVADGRNLWFYDRELAQVTVKPVAAALSATPVMLLSGTAAQLRESFDISPAGSRDGLEWVSVTPRASSADFNRAQLGFAHDQLERMVVNDRLGQTVQLDFSRSERNAPIDPAQLQFKPPAGVDVIGTPQS